MRIALSTGGGDAPGLNAVIRAAVLTAIDRGWHVLGIRRGYAGLLGEEEVVPLTRDSVRGIGHLGGTILHTTNRGNPFSYPVRQPDGSFVEIDRSDELMVNARNLGINAIVAIGGDGSLAIAQQLAAKGMRVVCVPKTIDNDVSGTHTTRIPLAASCCAIASEPSPPIETMALIPRLRAFSISSSERSIST